MSAFKVVKAIALLLSVLLILTGLAYLWHYIPESSFTGVQPPEDFQVEAAWQEYNELTGWSLVFTGVTTLTFVTILRKYNKSLVKYLLLVGSSIFLSLLLASMVATLVEIFIL